MQRYPKYPFYVITLEWPHKQGIIGYYLYTFKIYGLIGNRRIRF